MNHEKRIQLADRLTEMLLQKYEDEILLGGVYGSAARGTDTEYSDLEMLFVVKNRSKAKHLEFTYESMPVTVDVQKESEVERDITEVNLYWPLKMGRLFNLKLTCGDKTALGRFRRILDGIPEKSFTQFIAEHTPLCYEGLRKLESVKTKGNTHETGLFVGEILIEFMLLAAIYNREFVNHDYFGGLFESFKFKYLPRNYENLARLLMDWTSLGIDEIIS